MLRGGSGGSGGGSSGPGGGSGGPGGGSGGPGGGSGGLSTWVSLMAAQYDQFVLPQTNWTPPYSHTVELKKSPPRGEKSLRSTNIRPY